MSRSECEYCGTPSWEPHTDDCPVMYAERYQPKENTMACKCTPDSATRRDSYCPMHGCPHNDASQCDCRKVAAQGLGMADAISRWGAGQHNVSVEVGPGLDEISPALLDALRQLGEHYGPTGVARAAKALVRPPIDPDVPGPLDHCYKCPLDQGVACKQGYGCAYRAPTPLLDNEITAEHPLEDLLAAVEAHPPAVPTSKRARAILEHAADLVDGDRNSAYGDARDNFTETGGLWTIVLGPVLRDGAEITAEQVALCMNQVKVARLINNPTHADSWTDGSGYLGLGGGIAEQTAEESHI